MQTIQNKTKHYKYALQPIDLFGFTGQFFATEKHKTFPTLKSEGKKSARKYVYL